MTVPLDTRVAEAVHHHRSRSGRRAALVRRRWQGLVARGLDALRAEGVVALHAHPHAAKVGTGADFLGVLGPGGQARGFVVVCVCVGRGDVGLRPGRGTTLTALQRAQIEAVDRAGGVALLAVQMGDVRAVIPWAEVAEMERVTRDVARGWECRAVADGLRREMVL